MAENPKNRKTPAETLKLFRVILKEAARVYRKAPSEVSSPQFNLVAKGRLGRDPISRLGGYVTVRNFVAPQKGNSAKVDIDLVSRILKGAA
jgi:hypothetical protein